MTKIQLPKVSSGVGCDDCRLCGTKLLLVKVGIRVGHWRGAAVRLKHLRDTRPKAAARLTATAAQGQAKPRFISNATDSLGLSPDLSRKAPR